MTPPDRAALESDLAAASDEDRAAMLRRVATQVALCDDIELIAWKDWCARRGLGKSDFSTIVRHVRSEDRKRKAASVQLAEVVDRKTELAVAKENGELLASPRAPMDVARGLVSVWKNTDGHPHVTYWRGQWYRWTNCDWRNLDEDTITNRLYTVTEHAKFVDNDGTVRPWAPYKASIDHLRHALGHGVLYRPADKDPDVGLYCLNGVVDIETRDVFEHHPRRFNLVSLPFPYEPQAECPKWLGFLDQALPGKPLSIAFLQEWIGYLLSGETKHQKIAVLVGPKRCGKGTIGRVVYKLLGGAENVASPSLSDIASHFGMEQLIDKSLVLMGDVNWRIRESAEAGERIKNISGEDPVSVPRKNKKAWNGRLGVRFMFMTNDMPVIPDASGAAQLRLIPIEFRESFAGREDVNLQEKLDAEMTGILLWALQGATRLRATGRFTMPEGAEDLGKEMERAGSPASGFLQDRAQDLSRELRDRDVSADLDDVFAAYLDWCEKNGREHRMEKNQFSAALRSAGNGLLRIERTGRGKERKQVVYGLEELYVGSLGGVTRWLSAA